MNTKKANESQQNYEVQAKLDGLISEFTDQRLLEERVVFLSEGVTASVAKKVISSLLLLDSVSKDPILLYVNSPGGEVNSGFAIYDTIRFIESEVKIINTGLCASIATIINIAAKKENRLSMPNARFLIHQPLIMGQIFGPASDLEITASEILKTRTKINGLLAKECGQDLSKVEEDTTRDYWMTAEESLEYGLISRIITNHKEMK